jgi:60 kDa SS-A/Ro ribonucleoprotein
MSAFKNMANKLAPKPVPVTQPIPGRETDMVQMASGGQGFRQDDLLHLRSILILGNENASFYEGANDIQEAHVAKLMDLVKRDPRSVVELAIEVSVRNITLKNLYPLFALAAVIKFSTDRAVKAMAWQSLNKVARTGSDFLGFVAFLLQLKVGFGRSVRRGVAKWYLSQTPDEVTYQVLKYWNRNGLDHEKVFRMAHVAAWAKSLQQNTAEYASNPIVPHVMLMSDWMKDGDTERFPVGSQFRAWKAVQNPDANPKLIATFIKSARLTHEMIPSNWAGNKVVWTALAERMPLNALVRSVNKLSAYGVFDSREAVERTISLLTDKDSILKARLHPLNLMKGQSVYAQGHGDKGNMTWTPVPNIIDAMDDAFYLAMDLIEQRDEELVLAIDVSGSMRSRLPVGSLMTHQATAAIGMAALRRFRNVRVIGVDTSIHSIALSKRQRLDDAHKTVSSYGGGGTNLELLFTHLIANKIKADAVLFLTDTESWVGGHPSSGWTQYRQKINPKARALYVQTQAQGYQVADPNDPTCRAMTGFGPEVFTMLDLMLDGQI